MKPAKLKLLESTFVGYTGVLCGVQFKDGVSVKELPFVDQQRICASMRAETIEGKNVSPSAAYTERYDVTLEDVKANEPKAEEIVPMARGVKEPAVPVYSREELEALADDRGIAGLREVGNKLDVKAKDIVGMINGILKAQGGE